VRLPALLAPLSLALLWFWLPAYSQDHQAAAEQVDQSGDLPRAVDLCLQLGKTPAVPEEAARRFAQGVALARAAKSPQEFRGAASEYREGLKFAPCVSEAYFNYAVLLEAGVELKQAVGALQLYLRAAPGAADAPKIRSKIYELEARLALVGSWYSEDVTSDYARRMLNQKRADGTQTSRMRSYSPAGVVTADYLWQLNWTVQGQELKATCRSFVANGIPRQCPPPLTGKLISFDTNQYELEFMGKRQVYKRVPDSLQLP
jgi:tetratricopeptide (TPR) repeat protein